MSFLRTKKKKVKNNPPTSSAISHHGLIRVGVWVESKNVHVYEIRDKTRTATSGQREATKQNRQTGVAATIRSQSRSKIHRPPSIFRAKRRLHSFAVFFLALPRTTENTQETSGHIVYVQRHPTLECTHLNQPSPKALLPHQRTYPTLKDRSAFPSRNAPSHE